MILNPKPFTREILSQIRKIVKKQGTKKELCGVIVAEENLIRFNTEQEYKIKVRQVKNVADGQIADYQLDPVEFGEKAGDSDFFGGKKMFIGFWHTHPHWSSDPSQVDIPNMLIDRWYFIYSCRDDDMTYNYKGKVK